MGKRNQDGYSRYINSTEWQQNPKRLQAIRRDQGRCVLCDSSEDLEVHHRTYKNFGAEKLEDLYILCRPCHEIVTDLLRRRRYEAQKPIEVTDSKVLNHGGTFPVTESRPMPKITESKSIIPKMDGLTEVLSAHKEINIQDSRCIANPAPQWADSRSSERVEQEHTRYHTEEKQD